MGLLGRVLLLLPRRAACTSGEAEGMGCCGAAALELGRGGKPRTALRGGR